MAVKTSRSGRAARDTQMPKHVRPARPPQKTTAGGAMGKKFKAEPTAAAIEPQATAKRLVPPKNFDDGTAAKPVSRFGSVRIIPSAVAHVLSTKAIATP